MLRLLIAIFLSTALPAPGDDDITPLPIGAAAPDFVLPGIDGKIHSLADCGEADVLAILFTCNHCPTAQAAEERVIKLVDDYRERSFRLVAISPNDPLSVRLNELGYAVLKFLQEEHAALPKRTAASVEREGRKTNNYHFNGDAEAFIAALDPEWDGPIPHTVLIAPGGRILWRHSGEVDPVELRKAILDHLGRFYTPE